MALRGKGSFIWKIRDAEGGNPAAIAQQAVKAGLSHVLLKIADGNYAVNIDATTQADLAGPVALSLKAKGIQVWGWHYVYGYDPIGEARIACDRVRQLGLQGYVIDAEMEYKNSGKSAAKRFMNELRAQLGDLPIALSSYRFPSYHPQLPWREFLDQCDYNMPQVYWEKAHNAGAQLRRCVQEFQTLSPTRPIIPTGPTYKNDGWRPGEADILEFLNTARALGLSAANFFSWDECRRDHNNLWSLISSFNWPGGATPTQLDPVEKLFVALNTRKPAEVSKLYGNEAVHINAQRTVMGAAAIQEYYDGLFSERLPEAVFTLTGLVVSENRRVFHWTALSPKGRVADGNDTIGLLNNKIAYHYTQFTVLPA